MLFKKAAAILSLPLLSQAITLQEAIAANSNLSSLGSLLTSYPAVLSALGGAKNITLLAPSNSAIAAFLNSTDFQTANSTAGAIEAVLQYHALNGAYTSGQLVEGSQFVPSLLTNPRFTNVTGGQRVQIVKSGSSVSAISGLLRNSTVTQADIAFDSGVIHVINSLLTLPTSVEVALTEGSLSALYGAVKKVNALSLIESLSNVTIFAPNNAAFARVGSIFSNISDDVLANVLTYHVVVGQHPYYSTSLSNTSIPAVNGGRLQITVVGGSVFVNGAKVVQPNILVAGGVVHVIDQILNPQNSTATPSGTQGQPAFSGATSVSSTPYTSGVPTPSVTLGGGAAASSASAPVSTGAGAMITPVAGSFGGVAGALVGVVGAAALLI